MGFYLSRKTVYGNRVCFHLFKMFTMEKMESMKTLSDIEKEFWENVGLLNKPDAFEHIESALLTSIREALEAVVLDAWDDIADVDSVNWPTGKITTALEKKGFNAAVSEMRSKIKELLG